MGASVDHDRRLAVAGRRSTLVLILMHRELGRTIRVRRAYLDMPRKELARLTGYSNQGLWKIEKGLSDPKLSSLDTIAKALSTTVLALLIEAETT